MQLPVGSKRAVYEFKPRIIIATQSVERKQGKTHFSMTAPPPLYYFNFDKTSREDVLAKFPDKEIYDKDYNTAASTQNEATAVINEFERDYALVLKEPAIRTIVIDTGSSLYELLQTALFGKTMAIPPHFYSKINIWFGQTVMFPALSSDKNLITNFLMGKQYVKDAGKEGMGDWNGKYERKGFRDGDGLAHMLIHLEREQPPTLRFKATVLKSSQNAVTVGDEFISDPYSPEPGFDCLTDDAEIDAEVFAEHRCSFPFVAQAVFPMTKLTDWV